MRLNAIIGFVFLLLGMASSIIAFLGFAMKKEKMLFAAKLLFVSLGIAGMAFSKYYFMR